MDCRSYYRSPSSAFARWMRMGRVLVACLAVASASACAQSKVSTAPPQGPAPSPAAPPPPEPTVAPSPTLTVPESQRPLVIGGAEPVRVSALLPLSGSAASVGSVLRNAAEMALFDVADERFVLSFYDTQSTPQGAVAAANEALSGGAQMIVGPLFGASAAQVGPLARARGVPVLTFSNNQAVAGDGVWVFGLLPADQVERVVGYAASTGLARYGAVVPANAYGDAVRESLLDALAKARAGVPRVVTYPPGADTAMFGEIIERFATDAELDAVLIPEGGAALRNIAPQLAFHDVDQSETRFLGTALWSDPTLGSENTLQDAWFAAPSPLLRKGLRNGINDCMARCRPACFARL